MDVRSDKMSEFDLEIRRRLWCALYTWDRYVSLRATPLPRI